MFGETFTDEPVCEVLQLYVVAPLAANVLVAPAQIVAELTVTTGKAFTSTVVVFIPIQLFAPVPVMV